MTEKARRGDVVWVDFGRPRGSEPAGRQPALIVQNDVGNVYSPNTIVVAVTRTLKPYPVSVVIEPAESGLPERSMVDCSLILTIDKERILSKAGSLGRRMPEIDTALKTGLALS